jgi:hypothetical protein
MPRSSFARRATGNAGRHDRVTLGRGERADAFEFEAAFQRLRLSNRSDGGSLRPTESRPLSAPEKQGSGDEHFSETPSTR